MICNLLERNLQLGFLCRIALRFLDGTVSSLMGCFIGCFRVRDDRRLPSSTNLVSNSSRPKRTETAVSRNDLSSLFLVEEEIEDSPSEHNENLCLRSPDTVKGLKDEAIFLKACGTLAETPVEIRKVSGMMKLSPANGRGSDPSKFHSWLPNTSVGKFPQDIKLHQPQSFTNLSEKLGTASDAPERMPSSCISSAQNDGRLSAETTKRSGTGSYTANITYANQTEKVDTLLPCKAKSVRLDCETDMSTSGSTSAASCQSAKKTGRSGETIYSSDQPQSRRPLSEAGLNEISSGTELKPEGSLSDWFKPQSAMVENNPNTAIRNLRPPKTPGDRPIIGIVATHWNEEEASRVPPKWWDGNGIPNSTTKYKEDQKVSWHATPFEERLEKALSEETLISRKHSHGKLIAFDENEESDTALSQLQASSHQQSVVSF